MTDDATGTLPALFNDRYEVVEIIGAGGEGTLARAFDRRHERSVALKLRRIPPDPERVEQLLVEARTLLALRPHPSLPLARDDFFDGDRHVLVLDWVDGVDLGRVLADEGDPGLPASTVLRWLADASAALTHLHTGDPPVVHGDVKPANLVLTSNGQVVLVDFGTSSAHGRPSLGGTLGFRAPEVAAGAPPTRAADVYGLAATAFALLTGGPPAGILPTWQSIDPTRAAAIERALRRGMATDPRRRTPTTGELIEELRAGWATDPLPTGVLSFLATDIVSSTRLWQDLPDEMPGLLAAHLVVVDRAVERHHGRRIGDALEGDATLSVFTRAGDAVRAAIEIQRELASGTVQLHCGIHTGEADASQDGRYPGATVSRTARIRALADAGQVLLSSTTARLIAGDLPADARLVELGPHRLRGFDEPERLVAVDAAGLAVPPDPNLAPYPGLAAFEPEDHALFFGRAPLAAAIAARVAPGRVIGIIGASGSGKSSLARAGVVPLLDGASVITPGPHPLAALPAELPGPLVVDQLEELFTLCPVPAERAEFAARVVDLPHGALITMRGDLYTQLAELPALAQAVATDHVLLGPLTADELRDAIEGPAQARGLELEGGLVDVILADARAEPGALPLVAHALRETWLRRDGRTLTLEGYRDTGGVRGALNQTAEELYARLDADQRELARNTLLRMVEPGEGVADTRRRVDRSELDGLGETDAVDDVLQRLAAARLVTLDGSSAEPAHETLLAGWPRLRSWIDASRDQLRLHRNLTTAASEWERGGRDPSELYRGARLAAAREYASALSPSEQTFLDASDELEAQAAADARRAYRRQRRLRVILSGAAVALLLVAVGFVVQRQRSDDDRRDRETAELVARSQAAAQADVNLALQLAIQAASRADTPATAGGLLGALAARPHLTDLIGGAASTIEAMAVHPTRPLIALGSLGEVRLWDVDASREVANLAIDGFPFAVDFSPAGDELLAASPDVRRLSTWDLASGTELASWESPETPRVVETAYLADGGAIVALHLDLLDPTFNGFVQVHDRTTLEPVGAPLELPAGQLDEIAVAPDGTLVLGAIAELGDATRGDPVERSGGVWLVSVDGTTLGQPELLPESAGFAADSVAAGPDVVVAGREDGGIQVWERDADGWSTSMRLNLGQPVYRVTASADGRYVAAGSENGVVAAWDRARGVPITAPLLVHAGRVSEVAFTADGARLISGGYDRVAAVQSLRGVTPITTMLETGVGPLMPAWAPDGSAIAVADLGEASVRAVDPATGDERWLATDVQPVNALTVTGEHVVVAQEGPVLDVRDAATGQVTAALELGDAVNVLNVAASPDGQFVAAALELPDELPGRLAIWRTDTWERRLGPPTERIIGLAFAPDGARIVTGHNDGRVRSWRVDDVTIVAESAERSDEQYLAIAFLPGGERFAAAGFSGGIDLFDATDLTPIGSRLTGHGQIVDGLGVAAGWIVSAGEDGDLRVWDPDTGLPVGEPLPTGGHSTVTLSVAPDGRRVVVPASDGSLAIVAVDPPSWFDASCGLVQRITDEPACRDRPG